MSNKPNNADTSGTISTSTEDFKDQSVKHNFSKFEHDLYHEEDDVALPVVRVKRISLPNKGDKWKIFSDNKVIWTLDGKSLNNKEKDFLKTIEGFNWLLLQAKSGIKSCSSFKRLLEEKLSIINPKPIKNKTKKKKK